MIELKNQQPDFPKPDLSDAVSVLDTRIQWLRFVGPQLNLDPNKLVLGEILSQITGDDMNCFSWAFDGLRFRSDDALLQKQKLLGFLHIESTTKEIPPDIIVEIVIMHEKMNSLDWSDTTQFLSAQGIFVQWQTWIKERIETDIALHEAVSYAIGCGLELSPHWNVFIETQKSHEVFSEQP